MRPASIISADREQKLENARRQTADLIGCSPKEVVFVLAELRRTT